MNKTWHPEKLQIRRMNLQDVDHVLVVEKRSFTAPWSRQAFMTELIDNHLAHYVVADYGGRIIGYAGIAKVEFVHQPVQLYLPVTGKDRQLSRRDGL